MRKQNKVTLEYYVKLIIIIKCDNITIIVIFTCGNSAEIGDKYY